MGALIERINRFFSANTDFVLPLAVFFIIASILIPLPTGILDTLLLLNISLSFLLMVAVLFLESPLQLSAFPTLLVMITFYRLSLNISTTRMILQGAVSARPPPGQVEQGYLADLGGNVIATFGNFVGGGVAVIGIVVFIIILIVQFVVITKGATRIAEVAARFTLDAMPGKQMAIDADLNAGIVDEKEARTRREDISREAEFFGAMDGASKFVRGDAIAGLIITVVNIAGGLLIAVLINVNDLSFRDAFRVFTLLTIGDGLVSAVPSLVVSLAAAFLVTRTKSDRDMGSDLFRQLFRRDRAVLIVAVFMAGLALTPFFQWQLLAIIGALLGIFLIISRTTRAEAAKAKTAKPAKPSLAPPEKVEALLHVDPMELEIGYGLIRLVDTSQGGDLLERITMIRRQVALDLGFVVPPIRIRDNMQLEPNQYVVKIRGTKVAQGQCMVDHYLAMDSGIATGQIDGIPTTEPAFGLPALWISEQHRQRGEALGYTVVDATSVVATHLTEVIKNQAADLLTREDLSALIENLKSHSPKIVEEVVGGIMKPGELQRVLQNLLHERVSIRDLGAILHTLAEYAPRTKDPEILTEYVRNSLSRQVCQALQSNDGKLHLITLDPQLEDMINANIERTEGGSYLKLAPQTLNKVMDGVAKELEKLVTQGFQPVILCAPQIRSQLKKIVDGIQPGIAVVSYNEISKDTEVESHGMVMSPG